MKNSKLIKFFIVLFTLVVILTASQLIFVNAQGELGTEENPIEIRTADEFKNIANTGLSKYYILMNDIDIGIHTPIGSRENPFTGFFYGNGYTITVEMKCSSYNITDIGLFQNVEGTIFGLNVVGVISYEMNETYLNTDRNYLCIGSITGYNTGNIYFCNSVVDISLNIDSTKYIGLSVGGVVGRNCGDVQYSGAEGNIIAKINDRSDERTFVTIGGAIGANNGNTICDYSTGNINISLETLNNNMEVFIGGFMGQCDSLDDVIFCNASGDVSCNIISDSLKTATTLINMGGFCGFNWNDLYDCYATGDVIGTGVYVVGGLCGGSLSIVDNCYSTGNVTGDIYVDRFIACDVAYIGKICGINYYNKESILKKNTNIPEFNNPNQYLSEATGLTVAQMTGKSAINNMEGFDFDEIWAATPNTEDTLYYPQLQMFMPWVDNVSTPNTLGLAADLEVTTTTTPDVIETSNPNLFTTPKPDENKIPNLEKITTPKPIEELIATPNSETNSNNGAESTPDVVLNSDANKAVEATPDNILNSNSENSIDSNKTDDTTNNETLILDNINSNNSNKSASIVVYTVIGVCSILLIAGFVIKRNTIIYFAKMLFKR